MNTYYYLLESLKTQKPQLIILEAYASTFSYEYSDPSRIIKNNLGIKRLRTRYEALKVSAPEDSFDDYLFSYRLWHSRYEELGESDYESYYRTPMFQYFRGFGINFAIQPMEMPSALNVKETLSLAEKTEEYYRKIIELSIEEEIPLLVVVSPYNIDDKAQKLFNQSELIAKEYGVDFINFNSMDYYNIMELSFDTDFADPDHLNHLVNVKYTEVLGNIVREKYKVSDRRDESEYESWKLHSRDVMGRVRNHILKEEKEFDAYLNLLQDRSNDYTIVVAVSSNTGNMAELAQLSSLLGIEEDDVKDGNLYVIKDGQVCCQLDDLSWKYEDTINGNKLCITKSEGFENNSFKLSYGLFWNGREYMTDNRGIYFFAYDNFSMELVNICNFNKNFQNGIMDKNNIL